MVDGPSNHWDITIGRSLHDVKSVELGDPNSKDLYRLREALEGY